MIEKSIETAEPSLRQLMNSISTAVEPPRDKTRPSAYGKQLCSLVYLRHPGSRTRIYPGHMS